MPLEMSIFYLNKVSDKEIQSPHICLSYAWIHYLIFISYVVEEWKWKTTYARRNDPIISHLMFADDLLLFGEAIEKQIRCVMETLQNICKMPDHKVSMKKIVSSFPRMSARI